MKCFDFHCIFHSYQTDQNSGPVCHQTQCKSVRSTPIRNYTETLLAVQKYITSDGFGQGVDHNKILETIENALEEKS